jgi:hypothetical protein
VQTSPPPRTALALGKESTALELNATLSGTGTVVKGYIAGLRDDQVLVLVVYVSPGTADRATFDSVTRVAWEKAASPAVTQPPHHRVLEGQGPAVQGTHIKVGLIGHAQLPRAIRHLARGVDGVGRHDVVRAPAGRLCSTYRLPSGATSVTTRSPM